MTSIDLRRLPQQKNEYFVPQGGLDIVNPPLLLPSGMAFDALNWEASLEAGYQRIGGYDNYVDGPTASEMPLRVAVLSVMTGSIAAGETLKGVSSGAELTFAVRYDGPHRMSAGQTSIAVYVTDVVGQFIQGEMLERDSTLSPATIYLDAIPTYLSQGTARETEEARARGESMVRAYMDKPGSGLFQPGSTEEIIGEPIDANATVGATLGVFVMADVPYVVRAKNPALTASGNTNAVFIRPARPTGSKNRYWEIATDQPDIPTDGARFQFTLDNFADPSTEKVMYGVSGTSKAFWYTGATFGFITTGMVDDRPKHICVHQGRIFLSFGGSLQFSSLKDPATTPAFPHLSWTPVVGAGELQAGSEITGLLSLTSSEGSGALLVSTAERLYILYGNGPEDYVLRAFSDNTGALESTLQWMGQPIFQNMFGLTQMSTTSAFGGFREATISGSVKTFMDARRGRARASMICRDKNQYRLFFDDGTALYVTFRGGKPIGLFIVKFKHRVTCAWSCKLSNNTELMLVGTEDGGLYKLDVGTSFAGDSIPHFIRFAFNHFRSPRLNKAFKRTYVEANSVGYAAVAVGYDLDYGGNKREVSGETDIQSPDFTSGGFYDEGIWDEGYWDSAVATPYQIETPGTGSNFSLRIRGDDNVSHPLAVTGVLIDFTIRAAKRGI